MHVESLWQFPIKGLGGRRLDQTTLSVDQTLPGDRRYALSTDSAKAAKTADGVWLQKAHFLQLMQTDMLAALSCRFDGDKIEIQHNHKSCFHGDLDNPNDRKKFEIFMAHFLGRAGSAPMRLHKIQKGAFTDQSDPLISLGGIASLDAFAAATKTKSDARRFRLNIMLATKKPFIENEWCGKRLQVGAAVIEIIDHVGRCAAINVNPETAKREPDHLAKMRQAFGHSDLGVFGRVVKGGAITPGDSVTQLDE